MSTIFSKRVWELALSIPEGRVTTYGTIAKAAGGGAMASRSIGSILSKFPNPNVIPWHRIVYAGGKIWIDEVHAAKRQKLYKAEGIKINSKGYISDFEEIFFDFTEMS
jgi:methylated-DNA-protein-cysteine methyltransferase-like protein